MRYMTVDEKQREDQESNLFLSGRDSNHIHIHTHTHTHTNTHTHNPALPGALTGNFDGARILGSDHHLPLVPLELGSARLGCFRPGPDRRSCRRLQITSSSMCEKLSTGNEDESTFDSHALSFYRVSRRQDVAKLKSHVNACVRVCVCGGPATPGRFCTSRIARSRPNTPS